MDRAFLKACLDAAMALANYPFSAASAAALLHRSSGCPGAAPTPPDSFAAFGIAMGLYWAFRAGIGYVMWRHVSDRYGICTRDDRVKGLGLGLTYFSRPVVSLGAPYGGREA